MSIQIFKCLTTAQELHSHAPELFATPEEAEQFLSEINRLEENHHISEDINLDEIRIFRSITEAFRELYDGSIDEFKREKDEDYNCLHSDYTDYYWDWVDENYITIYINDNKILILEG